MSCNNAIQENAENGSLTLTARAMVEGVEYAKYTIEGIGPNGAKFTTSLEKTSFSITDLVPGTWSITVEAYQYIDDTEAFAIST